MKTGSGLNAQVESWKTNGSTGRKWKSDGTWWHPEPKIKTENWSSQIQNEKTKRRDQLRFFNKNPT
jgi:hypothetical protein